ncbi:MAG: arginine--tRNA ligase [Rubrobacteridae bacterium]|nr:arginine--tRNA ligase [Rubrobacteridae bacterium]
MNMITDILTDIIVSALKRVQADAKISIDSMELPKITLERPREKAHGDWSTNIALALAGKAKMSPRNVAQIIVDSLDRNHPYIDKIEIAGPGFINFYLSNEWLYDVLRQIEKQGEKYGHSTIGAGQRVQIEFVSANPVGPMHIGHGRWAAVGDTLANVMTANGYAVEREFYVNDFGNQMNIFARSVEARYMHLLNQDIPFPEDGYQGEYIKDIAAEIVSVDCDKYVNASEAEREAIFKDRAYLQVLEHLKLTLKAMGVEFDLWFSERTLHDSSAVSKAIDELRARGHVYDLDGAVWFKTTTFGEDKDRVMIRANGEPTYFAADIAYHKNKLERGFDKIIDIWGADHHGYIARMKAAVQALGYPEDKLEVIIGQLVNLLRGGEPVRMSKRTGEMVTLDELLQEVGKDAVRFFFLMRSTDSQVDFDIELAKKESSDNPVFYVQYAHARISSIIRNAITEGMQSIDMQNIDYSRLETAPELDLIRKLAEWPEVLEWTARQRILHPITVYAQELASAFHYFYKHCQVIGEESSLSYARMSLTKNTQTVLKNVLSILGITAPDRM